MPPHAHDEDDDPFILSPGCNVGPVRRRSYTHNPKHAPFDRGEISRKPKNGQAALDYSVPVKPSSRVRIGIDYEDGAFVVLRWHAGGPFQDRAWDEVFHGYVVRWTQLKQELKNALIKAGMADRGGKIL